MLGHRARFPGRGQDGQALVFGMLLAAMAVLVFIRYFAVGQVVGAKAKQTHALDAAAYSGALIQARALNMLAYINRAQVGHQVAMAHLVTLGSWASFGGTQARQLASGNPPAYVVAMLFGASHGTAYLAAARASGLDSMAQASGQLARAYAAHDNIVRGIFGRVQEDIVAGLPAARHAAMQAVLARNYPDADTEASDPAGAPTFALTITDDNWSSYVQRYPGRQLRSFVQQAAAMYDFLAPRNTTASNSWAVSARCPALRHQLRRRGATTLDAAGRWQSVDTESFHALRSNRWIGCYYREYPMGWGWIPSAAGQDVGAPYVDDAPDDFSAQDFWRWVKDATNWDIAAGDANPLANSKAVAGRQRWPGGGIPSYFDIDTSRSGESLRFRVQLVHPGPDSLSITTRSGAETYFQRPEPVSQQSFESSNLFRPYWQARLAPATGAVPDSAGSP